MHIGLHSFRISGTDGVSLEAERWKIILERMGHQVTMIAGELDRQGVLIPCTHFAEPKTDHIHELAIVQGVGFQKVEKALAEVTDTIEEELKEIFSKFRFDRLIVANVFSLPIHLSLTLALEKIIRKFKIPTISRNHDFWWERQRYLKPSWREFFKKHFPPKNRLINHVTINSIAQGELKQRTGLDSVVIGDSFDFSGKTIPQNSYVKHWREDFGLKLEDIVFLQATRIVPRKQIELSIELVKKLGERRIVLVMAGYAGDEGHKYLKYLQRRVNQTGIRARFIGDRIGTHREIRSKQRIYTLWDCFKNCDLVTYPSRVEGFGNQFIEACFFKKPVFVNRYEVYKADLEPLGFETVAIDGEVGDEAVGEVRALLDDSRRRRGMVEKNFKIAKKHFSFEATQKKLEKLGF